MPWYQGCLKNLPDKLSMPADLGGFELKIQIF